MVWITPLKQWLLPVRDQLIVFLAFALGHQIAPLGRVCLRQSQWDEWDLALDKPGFVRIMRARQTGKRCRGQCFSRSGMVLLPCAQPRIAANEYHHIAGGHLHEP